MQEIIMEYIQEKSSTDGVEMMAYLLEKAEPTILADKDFLAWVKAKKTELASQRTPAALEAEKEAIRQRIIEREAKFNIGAKNAKAN